MSWLNRTGAAIAIIFYATSPAMQAALPERSFSTSRQFIVYGADIRLRGVLCDLAEETKKILLGLLQQSDGWKTPILVHAQYPQAAAPDSGPDHLSVSQTGAGLKLQLDLTIGADVSGPAVQRELLRTILLELMYRQQPDTPAGTSYVEPPDWLIEGTLALAPGRDASATVDALALPVHAEKIIALEEFLRQKLSLLDSPSASMYRAYAAALVSMLRDAPEGRARLSRFLSDLPQSSNDPMADLRSHFPGLGENVEALPQNWRAAVTRMASSGRYRVLSCEETERQLALALQIGIAPPQQPATLYSLEEFPTFIKDPAAALALQRLEQELLQLSTRANPIYIPVIGEYRAVVMQLQRRKLKRIPRRLAELRGDREQLSRRLGAIGDYLNWYEATQSHTMSGAFEEYMKAAAQAAEPEPRRHDPISVYLDALEAQF